MKSFTHYSNEAVLRLLAYNRSAGMRHLLLAALAMFLGGVSADAQPFDLQGAPPTGLTNAYGVRVAPVLVDIDNDGDLDCFLGRSLGNIRYFRNNGTVSTASFVEQTGSGNPLLAVSVGVNSKPAFTDIDGDGDLDCFVGANNGTISFYRNTGNASLPIFQFVSGTGNPLNGVTVGANAAPAFTDMDDDGDVDCAIGRSANTNSILYFHNDGDETSPLFVQRTGAYYYCSDNPPYYSSEGNPFTPYGNTNMNSIANAVPAFVDLNDDGESDVLVGQTSGYFSFFGVYLYPCSPSLNQPYIYSNSVPSNLVDIGASNTSDFSAPTFGDLDNDGDLDLLVGRADGRLVYFLNNSCLNTPTITACPSAVIDLSNHGSSVTLDNYYFNYGLGGYSNCNSSIYFEFSPAEITCADAGSVVPVTVTARDYSNGRATSCNTSVTVLDNQPPYIYNCPSTYEVFLNAQGTATLGVIDPANYQASYYDVCDVTVAVVSQPSALFTFTCANVGVPITNSNILFSLTDESGNASYCNAQVLVRDTSAPVSTLTSLPTKTLTYCNGQATYTTTSENFTATDNCSGTVQGSAVQGSPITYYTTGTFFVDWRFTDQSGNSSTKRQTVIVAANPAPTPNANCPTSPSPLAANANCVASYVIPASSASWFDDCNGDFNPGILGSLASSHNPGTQNFSVAGSPHTITYLATDAAGNTGRCTFTITVLDQDGPTVTANVNFADFILDSIGTQSALECGRRIYWKSPSGFTANDACSGVMPQNLTEVRLCFDPGCTTYTLVNGASGNLFDYGDYQILYFVRDNRGNKTQVGTTLAVSALDDDNVRSRPSITCPVDQVTATRPGACNADFQIFSPGGAQISDNCPGVAVDGPFRGLNNLNYWNQSPSNLGPNFYRLPDGVNTVRFVATDNSGRTATCTFTVTVEDQEGPTINGNNTCPADVTGLTIAECTTIDAASYIVTPSATDNCSSIVTLTYSVDGPVDYINQTFPVSSLLLGEGHHVITYLADDNNGNTSTCEFSIVLENTTPPAFSNCPQGIGPSQTVSVNSSTACAYVLSEGSFSTGLARDFSLGMPCDTGTISFRRLPGNTPVTLPGTLNVGQHTLVAIATDDSGNSAQCQFSVTVRDLNAPSVTNCPVGAVQLNTAPGQCYGLPNWTTPNFSDACGTVSTTAQWNQGMITQTLTANSQLPKGISTVTYTGTDVNGNPSICQFNVVVSDNQAPVFTCNATRTIDIISGCSASLTAPAVTDNCSSLANILVLTTSPVTLNAGTYTVTFEASDEAGQVSTCTQSISVLDKVGPVMTCPGNRTVNVTSGCNAAVSWNVSNTLAVDACDGNRPASASHAPGSTFNSGTTTVTYTASDTKGNQNTCSFTVTVNVSSVPTITCPTTPLVIAAGANCQAQITNALMAQNNPSASDACGSSVVFTNSISTPQTVLVNQSTSVTWTATNGNAISTCTRTVQVLDQSAPQLTCPANITVNTSQQQCSVDKSMVPIPTFAITDNCASSFTVGDNRPAVLNVGIVPIILSAGDGNGNVGTCTWLVTVRDMTPPSITCPQNVTVNLAANAALPTQVNLGAPSANDNCVNPGTQTPTNNAPQAGFGLGTTSVTWTVLDAGGNASNCVQLVTVTQQTAPPPPPPSSACWDFLFKRTPGDASSDKFFGTAVDIDGDVAVVGAMNDDQTASNAGAAYVLYRNGGAWTQAAKLRATDGVTFDLFGSSVAVSGDYIIVGAPESDPGGNTSRGAAYIFFRNQNGADQWGQVAKLVDATGAASDKFGSSVGISGDYAIVGAPLDDNSGTNSGSAFIFSRSVSPGNWLLSKTLANSAAGDNFGISVDLEDDFAVVGSRNDDDNGSNAGTAFVYDRNAGTGWDMVSQLMASDGQNGDNFGQSVAISGDHIVVGAPLDDDGGSSSGSAFVFHNDGIDWVEIAKVYAADQQSGDQFGFTVDIDGTNAVVGARNDDDLGSNAGSAYVFNQNEGGADNWGQTDKLTANDGAANDLFGTGVAIFGTTIIVGSQRDDVGVNTDQGSIYVYDDACGNKPSAKRNAKQLASKVAVDCFPNPLTDYLNIEVVLTQEEMLNITIADAQGRIVATPYNDKANGTLNLRWDAARFDNGVYFVRVQSQSHNQVIPVTIVRIP